MIDRSALETVQSAIGYKFKNENILITAFTHSSYVNEHKAESNEQIEFLGDCVLNFLVGEKLFFEYSSANEGVLSAKRSALVSRAPLARLIDESGLIEYLQVGAGVDKSAFSVKTRSNLFEAIVGAVYLDGGIDACREVLERIFFSKVRPERDYKTELQDHAVKHGLEVKYETLRSESGFCAYATLGDSRFTGMGNTKHEAEIAAARAALSNIGR